MELPNLHSGVEDTISPQVFYVTGKNSMQKEIG